MKIDNSVKSAAGLPPNDGRTRSAKESPKADSASGSGEKVELSSLSARLQQMEETIANTPVVDVQRWMRSSRPSPKVVSR